MTTASNYLQDLQSHAVALRQRGCERIVDFIQTATAQDAKPVLSDELLRKMATLVTDLSPIVSTLAMEFIDLLFQKLPPGEKVLDDEDRVWVPSLTIINQMTDALLCRLADAKAPIRAKAKATLTSVVLRSDVSIMLHKLHNLSTSRNVYMKRNILELMIEILSSEAITWSKEELFSCAKNVILTANVFLPQDHTQASGELLDMAFRVLELLLQVSQSLSSEEGGHTNNVTNMLSLFGDLHVRTETLGKLHLMANQMTNMEAKLPVSVSEQPILPMIQEESIENAKVNVRYERASLENFDLPTVCRFFLSEEDANKTTNSGLNFVSYDISNQTEPGFVYLPKNAVSLSSTHESLQLLEKLTKDLNDEENWQKRYQSLCMLQSFVWGSGSINNTSFSPCLLYEHVTFAALMRQLQDVIVLQMQDLRSMIVKEVCRGLSVMVYQFHQYKTFHLTHTSNAHVLFQKQNIFPLIDIMWPQVLKLLVSKTQIMSSSADLLVRVCLFASFDETHSQATFSKWCTLAQDMLRSKNTLLHRFAMEYLLLAYLRFTHSNHSSALTSNNETLFISCLKMGLSDAHSDARKFARVLYRVLQQRDMHVLGESLWMRCETDLDPQVLRHLKVPMKDETVGDMVLSENCYGLTWSMLLYIRHAKFALYDVLHESDEPETETAAPDAVLGTEKDLSGMVNSDPIYAEDDFDWMAAATSDIQPLTNTTAVKASIAPKVRMSMLSSAASRPLLPAPAASVTNNNVSVNGVTAASLANNKPSLLMGGARRLSVAALPMPTVPAMNHTSTAPSSLLGGGARRMSFMPPPAVPSATVSSSSLSLVSQELPMVSEEEHLFNDDLLANLDDTSASSQSQSSANAMSSFSRRMSMVTSAKRVLQPVQPPVVSSNVNAGDATTAGNTKPTVSVSKTLALNGEENMHPSDSLSEKPLLKKKLNAGPVQQVSELDTFKQLLASSVSSPVNKVKLLDLFAQHLSGVFARRNDTTAVDTLTETRDIIHLCFPVMWDVITDTNVKLYTEAMKTMEVCFNDRYFSETFLLPSNHLNNSYNNTLLSTMCLKMFTALIDAKPVAKDCINKTSALFLKHVQAVNSVSGDTNMVTHTVLKVLFARVKELPERALAAAFQFAGALIPTTSLSETNTVNLVPFVQEVVLRCMHVLVPNSVNLDVDLQFIATDTSSSVSTIPNNTTNTRSKTSNNAINNVKPSPVAMLAGKRVLVKLYEYVESSNQKPAATKNADSLFFKAVSGFSLAQQNVLKTLLVSLMPASQFDLKLTQQMKREKQLLLLGSKKNAAVNGAIVANETTTNVVKTTDTDTLLTIVTQLTQQQPSIVATVSPRVSPVKVETQSPVNGLSDIEREQQQQQEEKLALLDAVVQQVCRSPSVASASLSLTPPPSVSKDSRVATPTVMTATAISPKAVSPLVANSFSVSSPVAVSPVMTIKSTEKVVSRELVVSPVIASEVQQVASSPTISEILTSSPSSSGSASSPSFTPMSITPSATPVSSAKQTVSSSSHSTGKHLMVVASSSPQEKAENVLSLLSSVRKVSTSPVSSISSPMDKVSIVPTELFADNITQNEPEEIETVSQVGEIRDYPCVKAQLLKLDTEQSHEVNADIVETVLEQLELLSLTAVQAMESILLLLDTPLFLAGDNSSCLLLEKVHLVMSSLWDTCVATPSSDNMTSVLEKVFVFLKEYAARDTSATHNTLCAVETMTVNFTVHIVKRFLHFLHKTQGEDEVVLNVCRWLLNVDTVSSSECVSPLVLKLQLFACVLQTSCVSSVSQSEQWDVLWQAVVAWASAPQVLGHSTATLVRQQATLCLARVFCWCFYRPSVTDKESDKERKEKCLRWFLPLTVMQRKLLMVYVEKFRATSAAQHTS